ncbi:MAG: hypothetical protein ACI82Q_001357 [Nonlabens sp.]|jgi:hypothetical protein
MSTWNITVEQMMMVRQNLSWNDRRLSVFA